ncbi:hypothetical protein MN116_006042 [Schistosoma mekongi]|uniref:RAD51 interacting motif domain-containing protein n=1 Tax=Schistosoma mekongi TaxID=38744 RepID=A0AAE1ZB06_SCHME|nr:hypothetical protein MN116_006042 [Schistosoma mekongi]
MTEKRSSRIRKVHNYALLGDSDDEFFSDNDDKLINLKMSNNKEEKPINKCTKAKKLTNDKSAKHSETTQVQRGKPISKTISEAKQNICNPSVSHSEVLKSVNVPSLKASPGPIPSTPTYSNSSDNNINASFSCKVFFPVTPTSGLRLGLSRTKRLRPLHANIRIA